MSLNINIIKEKIAQNLMNLNFKMVKSMKNWKNYVKLLLCVWAAD